jgi:hypothetical protein
MEGHNDRMQLSHQPPTLSHISTLSGKESAGWRHRGLAATNAPESSSCLPERKIIVPKPQLINIPERVKRIVDKLKSRVHLVVARSRWLKSRQWLIAFENITSLLARRGRIT